MKQLLYIRAPALWLLLGLVLGGCVKQVEPAAPPASAPAPEPFAAPAAAPSTPPTVGGIPAAAISAAERAKARVEAASTATLDHGVIYKQAKALLAEGKAAEALRLLDTIQLELLTTEQEKAITELRAQISRSLKQ